MRIEITPENESEKKEFKKAIYENVYEFALTGTRLASKVKPTPIVHTHGNNFVLLGKLAEIKERIRSHVNSH